MMHRPTRTLLFPAAALLIGFSGCKKSEPSPPEMTNTWRVSEEYSLVETVSSAASISRGSDGKFRAVGANPADSIVFSFYQNRLPVTDIKFFPYYDADTTYHVSFEAWMSGRHYYSAGPNSMAGTPVGHITFVNGKLHLSMSYSNAFDDDSSTTAWYRISADLQEP